MSLLQGVGPRGAFSKHVTGSQLFKKSRDLEYTFLNYILPGVSAHVRQTERGASSNSDVVFGALTLTAVT